jgi:tetratricopeptide (TPR) repeat protein
MPSMLQTVAEAKAAAAREDWETASRLWAEVVEQNDLHPDFWAHLARSQLEAGAVQDAIASARRAMELGAAYPNDIDGFPADHAAFIARCHARLGNAEEALSWLERAIGMGFRDLDEIAGSDDLAGLQHDAQFQELTGQIETTGLSRDEGWRYDLRFLVREIERRAYDPFGLIDRAAFMRQVDRIERAIPELTDAELFCELSCLLKLLDDGHAYIHPPEHREDLRLALPVSFYLFKEGLFVITAAPGHDELLGSKVLAFDGTSTAAALEAVDQVITRDNERWVLEIAPYRLRELATLAALGVTSDPTKLELTVRDRKGRVRAVSLTGNVFPDAPIGRIFLPPDDWIVFSDTLPGPKPRYLQRLATPYWFEHLPEHRAVYVQFNTVRNNPDDPFTEFTERLFELIDREGVERLIIDVRWNKGGNTMLFRPLLHRIVGSRVINRPGGLYVIIGRRTFSAAQNFTSFIDYHTEAIFVGEPTGSRPVFIGESSEFALPWSQAKVNVSDLHWAGTWPGDQRVWIAPHLSTPPTFASYRENRDPAMEAVLSAIVEGDTGS